MKTTSTFVLAATLLMLTSWVRALPTGSTSKSKLDLEMAQEHVMRAVPKGTPLPPIMESATFYDIPPHDYAPTQGRHLEYVHASQPARQAPLPEPVFVSMGGLARDERYRLTGMKADRLEIYPKTVAQDPQPRFGSGEWMQAPQRLQGMLSPEMKMDTAGPLEPWNRYHVVHLQGDRFDEEILEAAKKRGKSFYALDTDGAVYFFNTMDGGKTFTWTDHVQRNDANMIRNWVGTESERARWADLAGSSSAAQGGGRKFGRSTALIPSRVGPHMLKSQSALPRAQAEAVAERARVATGAAREPLAHGPGGAAELLRSASESAAVEVPWRKFTKFLQDRHGKI